MGGYSTYGYDTQQHEQNTVVRISTNLLQGGLQVLELDGRLLWKDGAAQGSGEGEAEARKQHL